MRKSRFTEAQIIGMIKEQYGRRSSEAGALALRLQQCQAALIARKSNAARGAPDA